MPKVNGQQIAGVCRELEEARREGKLTQDSLMYELAKLTLEFVEEYRPKQKPDCPMDVESFFRMTKEEKRQLTDDERQGIKLRIAHWQESVAKVDFENKSNEKWIRQCLECFERNGNSSAFRFSVVLNEHGDM